LLDPIDDDSGPGDTTGGPDEDVDLEDLLREFGPAVDNEPIRPEPLPPAGGGSGASLNGATGRSRAVRRPPTVEERRQAASLASRVQSLQQQPATSIVRRSKPGGHVDLGQAMRYQAQAEMNLRRTARPWERRRQDPAPMPLVKVAFVQDVSGSMSSGDAAAGSFIWLVRQALKPLSPEVTHVAFGTEARLIESDDHVDDDVVVFDSVENTAAYRRAISTAIDATGLDQPAEYKSVIVVCDGKLPASVAGDARRASAALAQAEVIEIWAHEHAVSFGPPDHRVAIGRDPAEAARRVVELLEQRAPDLSPPASPVLR